MPSQTSTVVPIGDVIRGLRVTAKLTLQQTAELANCSRDYLARVEIGKLEPSGAFIGNVVGVLGAAIGSSK